jgi:hypothetical protein
LPEVSKAKISVKTLGRRTSGTTAKKQVRQWDGQKDPPAQSVAKPLAAGCECSTATVPGML